MRGEGQVTAAMLEAGTAYCGLCEALSYIVGEQAALELEGRAERTVVLACGHTAVIVSAP